jgi:hypothetical protein
MREMEVFDKDGAGIPPGEFLRILNELDEDEPNAASFRFAVVVGEDNKPRLQMQSLPASAVLLSGKALLKGDRVPTVLVKEWQLTCTMFDGDQLLGPVPTLFADNVEVKFC